MSLFLKFNNMSYRFAAFIIAISAFVYFIGSSSDASNKAVTKRCIRSHVVYHEYHNTLHGKSYNSSWEETVCDECLVDTFKMLQNEK